MAWKATAWEKFLVVPGLALTSMVAFALLAAKVNHWASSPGLANLVETDRTSIGIIFQLIAHFLGMILVDTLCKSSFIKVY